MNIQHQEFNIWATKVEYPTLRALVYSTGATYSLLFAVNRFKHAHSEKHGTQIVHHFFSLN